MNTIIVCANREAVCDGYVDDRLRGFEADVLDAWTTGATAAYEDFCHEESEQEVELRFSTTHSDWRGGKYSPYQCGREFGGHKYGYQCGLVATLEVDPPQWLRDLVDRIDATASEERRLCCETLEAEVAEGESQ